MRELILGRIITLFSFLLDKRVRIVEEQKTNKFKEAQFQRNGEVLTVPYVIEVP
jgi:hypothetical protein